jgi:hypothetical protein
VTSGFRVTLPAEWKLIRGRAKSTLLEETRKPECEYGGRTYESGGTGLSILWSANQSFDYDSPNWGPTTPLASYQHAIAEWTNKAKTKELIEVATTELPVAPPVVKLTMMRGMMPHLRRQATYLAALREDGIAVVEMLSLEPSRELPSIVDYLLTRISLPVSEQALPPCKFKGRGSPAMWSKWKSAPK